MEIMLNSEINNYDSRIDPYSPMLSMARSVILLLSNISKTGNGSIT